MHRRLLGLGVKTGLGIGQILTGQDDLLLDHHRLAVALEVALGAKGHRGTAGLGRAGFGAFIDQAHLQRGSAAKNVLRLGGVLHTWQLHHDAIKPLLLYHRFGHAELVDTVVQGHHVLLERLLLDTARGRRLDRGGEFCLACVYHLDGLQFGKLLRDHALGAVKCCRITKKNLHCLANPADATVPYVFLAQHRAQIAGQGFCLLGQCCLHVDLQQKVHATAQVQSEIHRRGAELGQPRRRT